MYSRCEMPEEYRLMQIAISKQNQTNTGGGSVTSIAPQDHPVPHATTQSATRTISAVTYASSTSDSKTAADDAALLTSIKRKRGRESATSTSNGNSSGSDVYSDAAPATKRPKKGKRFISSVSESQSPLAVTSPPTTPPVSVPSALCRPTQPPLCAFSSQHVAYKFQSTTNVLIISSNRPTAARLLEYLDTLPSQEHTAQSVRCTGHTPVRVSVDM